MKESPKFIFVTGGVLSGVGKGIAASSIGAVLKSKELKVNIQKCDPYYNVDAGTLNPAEHGEVFVTKDGAETDLDLGHYERFLNIELTQKSSTMSGRVVRQVIEDERNGKYLGKTVQIIPHITNAMQKEIIQASKGFDVHIVEIGGTVGDYESTAFIEAIRQLGQKVGRQNVLYVHVVYIPFLECSKELKSKPAQNAVRDLRAAGIQPDILVARADHKIPVDIIKKLSLFTNVPEDSILPMETVDTVYRLPRYVLDSGIIKVINKHLSLGGKKADLKDWDKLVTSIANHKVKTVRVGLIAKYLAHLDTYMSIIEALKAACWSLDKKLDIVWIDAEKLNDNNVALNLKNIDGILVPGGFGSRGVEGKIAAAKYAILNDLPYFGICLGLQVGVIAATRLSGKTKANSTEFDPKVQDPVIDLMESQKSIVDMGGTMRLGDYDCELASGSKVKKLYGKTKIVERHRHRYEFNPKYTKDLNKQGIRVIGKNPKTGLAEVIESEKLKFFVATQYHPEFKSRPIQPHPLFVGFIKSLIK